MPRVIFIYAYYNSHRNHCIQACHKLENLRFRIHDQLDFRTYIYGFYALHKSRFHQQIYCIYPPTVYRIYISLYISYINFQFTHHSLPLSLNLCEQACLFIPEQWYTTHLSKLSVLKQHYLPHVTFILR